MVMRDVLRAAMLLFLLVKLSAATAQRSKNYVITQFGARGDGKTLNTQAIQQAIDRAFAAGGGKVVVPAGRFVTGPVQLKTNVELHLAADAFLLGSINRIDYGKGAAQPLIGAYRQHGIGITGKGEIDGRGRLLVKNLFALLREGVIEDEQWLVKRPTEKNRPVVIGITECDTVTVKGITIRNSAGWVQDYSRCKQVVIDSITVESTEYWNNDGIDIVNCNGVRITNCDVDAADDAICLKSEGVLGVCENVYVANCRMRSSANAFKLGTGSHGGFRNITAKNLTVYDTYRSAIALEAVDGGFLENIDIDQVKATRTGNAIFIRLGHRNTDDHYSSIKNVKIAHVYAEVPELKPDMGYPVEGPLPKTGPQNLVPASITGLPGHPVKDVVLEDIEMVYGGGATREKAYVSLDSLATVTENIAGYPEFSMFGELPAWGFYIRHVDGLTFRNVKLSYRKEDFRPAIVADDAKGLDFSHVQVLSGNTLPVLLFHNSAKPVLNNIQLPVSQDNGVQYKP
jgi:hypothetical protein